MYERPKTKVSCQRCGEEFLAEIRKIRAGKSKFCSPECSAASRVKTRIPNAVCYYCGKEFWRRSRLLSKSGLYFCCKLHKGKAQMIGGPITPTHYGTGQATYRRKAFDSYPAVCTCCGYNKVPEVLVVHHKDRDQTNNTIENLEILCPTCHEEIHFATHSGRWGSSNKKDGAPGGIRTQLSSG